MGRWRRGGGEAKKRRKRSGGAQVLCGAPSAFRRALKQKISQKSVPMYAYYVELTGGVKCHKTFDIEADVLFLIFFCLSVYFIGGGLLTIEAVVDLLETLALTN